MGTPLTPKPHPAGKLSVSTPLLSFLAGPHADAIAATWPAPHGAFLAMPAARRHAAAILLSRGARDLKGLAGLVERRRDREVATALVGNDAPGGLLKALGHMGETLWRAGDYERFLDLFIEPGANRVLRHMARIEPKHLNLIHELPVKLREAKLVSYVRTVQAARDVARALILVEAMNGPHARHRLEQALLSAKNAEAVFSKAATGLTAERFERPALPPALPELFAPVRTFAELERLALDFRNCLRDFTADLVNGRMAVFVWKGDPLAAVALRWDPAGWRLAEAEAAENVELPEPALRAVVADLVAVSVRTGPSTWTLANRLRRHIHSDEALLRSWRDRLELGELWD